MKKKHLKSVILLSKIATNFSIPGRQQQPKFQILFHENSSPHDLSSIYNDFGQGSVSNQLINFFGAKFKRVPHKKSYVHI